jgi:hypothetical protein
MGQGFYTVLAWGVTEQPKMTEDEADALYSALHDAEGVYGRSCYEADKPWRGFIIAENGAGISDDNSPCQLMSYKVLDAERLVAEVERLWPQCFAKCRAAWDVFAKTALDMGLVFPAPRLLLVNDYD